LAALTNWVKMTYSDHYYQMPFEYLNSQIEWENAQLGIHSGDEQINICLGL
jgi:hypothetical protein